jgi:uncharacterized membrane protein
MFKLAEKINNFLLIYFTPSFLKILYIAALVIFFLIAYLCYKVVKKLHNLREKEPSELVYLKYALPGEDKDDPFKR